jgi:protein gp37
MGKNTHIQWTNDTWNPWQGCIKVSPGCKYCYMYRDKQRYGHNPSVVVRSSDATFNAPLNKLKGPLVFTCSWSDFFIEQADPWREAAWQIIRATPHLTYQILTKRPENIPTRLPADWEDGYQNVWLGVSVETRKQLWRVYDLFDIPASVRFVSAEPLLDFIDFTIPLEMGAIDWMITGGESGIGKDWRKAHNDSFRQIRDDCRIFNVPFFHKQNGGNQKIDGAWGGRHIDGKTWNEFPHQYEKSLNIPTCPYCKQQLQPLYYEGYYDHFSYWGCQCKELPNAKEWQGLYVGG